MPKMPMLSGLAPPTGVDIQQITGYSHIRKRRIVGRIKLKHDFVKHTRHMVVTIALPQN